jgi:hypothetical protein
MAAYPVTFDVPTRPEKFERPQVFLRIIVYFVFSFIYSAVYLAFPILAAIWISQKGSEKFLAEDGPKIKGWIRSITGLSAYTYILTDKFPSGETESDISFDIQIGGAPTVGSALLRLIFSIPSAIVVGVLNWVASIIWLIAAVMILLQETYPEGLWDFQRGVVRWQARLMGYHASLVDPYPPFAFDTGPETATPAG